ncbi:MAG: DUF2589 domain-containing protein [Bacteroidales bacterium]|nr:DUF2589 domain-containing protein [Bacteroidales bacterium]
MPEDNIQTYGVAAALSEALEAVVFADSSAAYKAYNMIEKYAYGEDIYVDEVDDEQDENDSMNESKTGEMVIKSRSVGSTELAMAEFTIAGPDGKSKTVSIPKITMMPLPLLHVTEASFDIEMTANIESAKTESEESSSMNNSTTTKTDEEPDNPEQPTSTRPASAGRRRSATATGARRKSAAATGSAATGTVSRPTSAGVRRYSAATGTIARRLPDGTVRYYRPSTAEREAELLKKASAGMRPSSATITNQQMVIGNKTTSTETNASTIKMNVKVNLKQAELPAGIKLLLQAAANSLQVTAEDIKS